MDFCNGRAFAAASGKCGCEDRMSKRIYVGNLPFSATEDEVRDLFTEYGSVLSVHLVNDRDTGRPRGFGFVEMESEDADKAISALDQQDFGGRNLKVNEARPRENRSPKW
jgi:RNA recognition motif-containing protein